MKRVWKKGTDEALDYSQLLLIIILSLLEHRQNCIDKIVLHKTSKKINNLSNNNKKNQWNGLTLSAFRRDEESIRIVDSDRSRKLTDYYYYSTITANQNGGSNSVSTILGYGAMATSVKLAIRRTDGQKLQSRLYRSTIFFIDRSNNDLSIL
mmetsp:Transcript_20707/g.23629  ORF Transcript_20707/g.23629 Transcript_20707/m.23629 type:complete len:152 (-) Transcript_20707:54-509(-)